MSHELTATDKMVSTGGVKPWHFAQTGQDGRTTVVDGKLTVKEAMELAGLNFTVERHPLFADVDGTKVSVPGFVANVAGDTKEVLGIVTDEYKIIQNADLAKFMQELLKAGEGECETAGSLRGRRVVWLLMKLPQHVDVGGMENERLDLYMLGKTGHGGQNAEGLDGYYSFQILPTTIRVVCNNTLTWAIGGARNIFSIRHAGNVHERIEEAREALQVSFSFQKEIAAMADRLVQQPISVDQRDAFLEALVRPVTVPAKLKADPPKHHEAVAAAEHRAQTARARIAKAHEETADLDDIRWTKYGLLQGVSQWECHTRRILSSDQRTADERRFEITMGLDQGASFTTRAAGLLLGKATKGTSVAEREVADILAKAKF